MSINSPRTRVVFLLIWAGAFLGLGLYARMAKIGTGQYIILGGLILIFLGLLGIVLSLFEEAGRAGKDPVPINQLAKETRDGTEKVQIESRATEQKNDLF